MEASKFRYCSEATVIYGAPRPAPAAAAMDAPPVEERNNSQSAWSKDHWKRHPQYIHSMNSTSLMCQGPGYHVQHWYPNEFLHDPKGKKYGAKCIHCDKWRIDLH